jgi:filamentous hemagglutinin family protein
MCKVHPICWLLLICQIQSSLAGVSFDHSAVVSKAVQGQSLSGQMLIKPEFGKQVGGNLFHSFSHFNIGTKETATFTGNNSINNVIGRVTGGLTSHIDGHLNSTIPNANIYLLNPNGIIFGKNAQLDLQGSFHASTAAYLDFKNGGRFGALDLNSDVLVSAPPQAFGFLDSPDSVGTIKVKGATLDLKPKKTLSLTGGNVLVDDKATLKSDSGTIRLVATQDGQAIKIQQPAARLVLPAEDKAKLAIDNGKLNVQGNGGGRIELIGDRVSIANESFVNSSNLGMADAGSDKGIAIQAKSLSLDKSKVFSDSYSFGIAGDIRLNAKTINVTNNSAFYSVATSRGNAADFLFAASEFTIVSGSFISSATFADIDILCFVIAASTLLSTLIRFAI